MKGTKVLNKLKKAAHRRERFVCTAAGLIVGLSIALSGCLEVVGPSGSPSNQAVSTISPAPLRLDLFAGVYPLSGSIDGVGASARFNGPQGITSDGTNLYVTDSSNNTIRKIVISTGAVTTLAGAGSAGYQDGDGTAAQFSYPSGITTDGSNLYVSDYSNGVIRKVVIATGVVSTIAGTAGVTGSADGSGSAASFNGPYGIVTDDGTNLYVVDRGNNTVRRVVVATGAVTTLATGFFFNDAGGEISTDGTNLYTIDDSGAIRTVAISTGVVTSLENNALVAGCINPAICTGPGPGANGNVTTDGTNFYISNVFDFTIRQIVISSGVATNLAGSVWVPGSADGAGSVATFNSPGAIVKVGANLYVADTGNNTIRRIALPSGTVTTVAGAAPSMQSQGSTDSTGSNARFKLPLGAASDGTNVYISDADNNTIRKIVISTGVVSTLAGNPGVTGSADGTGASASFSLSFGSGGIATDGTNLYVADFWNHTIRTIVIATGAVTTLAGSPGVQGATNGTGSGARFSYPSGVATDGTNLYVADSGTFIIRKIVIGTGVVTTLAGSPYVHGVSDGIGGAASFSGSLGPTLVPSIGLTTDGINLYVADTYATTIRQVDIATAMVTTLAGLGNTGGHVDGIGSAARFGWVYGIATDGTDLYVTDAGYDIRKVSIATGAVSTLAGGSCGTADGVGSSAAFDFLSGCDDGYVFAGGQITIAGPNLYVADTMNDTVRKIGIATADVTTFAGQAPFSATGQNDGIGSSARFYWPLGMADDGTNLYVADNGNSTIRKIVMTTGAVTTFAGKPGVWASADGIGSAASLSGPSGLCSDGVNLYVADTYNSTIRQIDLATGMVTTLAGTAGVYGSADGTGPSASFSYPSDIATDGINLYVVDSYNSTIRKIAIATGTVTTLAGSAGVTGFADGVGPAAGFNFSWQGGITVVGSNLYVADTVNNTIRKIATATGHVTTLAGSAGAAGSVDGIAGAAKFSGPWGITNDGTHLHVADNGNDTIREITIGTGAVSTLAGVARQGTDGDGPLSSVTYLNSPAGIHDTSMGVFFTDGTTSIRLIH